MAQQRSLNLGQFIPPMTQAQKKEFQALVDKCQEYHAARSVTVQYVNRRSKMAKAITQEAVDKAVAKAVKAETKRCIAAVKGAFNGTDPTTAERKALKAAVAAIKEAPDAEYE
jgi:hypothetical protein